MQRQRDKDMLQKNGRYLKTSSPGKYSYRIVTYKIKKTNEEDTIDRYPASPRIIVLFRLLSKETYLHLSSHVCQKHSFLSPATERLTLRNLIKRRETEEKTKAREKNIVKETETGRETGEERKR